MKSPFDSPEFNRGLDRYWKSAVGGAAVALPVIVASGLGASSTFMTGYLVVAVFVLSIVVIRQRRSR